MVYRIGQVVVDNQDNAYGNLTFDSSGQEKIADGSVNIIQNIIHASYPEAVSLKRLGIQSRPGSKFAIGNEIIYIGRSGSYELFHDLITVSDLKVLSSDVFIIDFRY